MPIRNESILNPIPVVKRLVGQVCLVLLGGAFGSREAGETTPLAAVRVVDVEEPVQKLQVSRARLHTVGNEDGVEKLNMAAASLHDDLEAHGGGWYQGVVAGESTCGAI